MQPHELYRSVRARLLDLAPTLTGEQQSAPLAATPPWSAADGYRHLAGVCADVLDGNMANAASPDWTAAHLAARSARSLPEVCAEWAERGAVLDERIATAGPAMAFLPYDAWTHEQDIRAAVGAGTVPDDEICRALADLVIQTMGPFYGRDGAPALHVVIDGGAEGTLGEGMAPVTLETSAFELLRIVFGRRSEAQVRAARWSAVDDGVVAAVHLFDFPPADIVES